MSKYICPRPNSLSAHHLAYVPKVRPTHYLAQPSSRSLQLPDTFKDWYQELHGEPASEHMKCFCRHKVMHAVWTLLLDPEFCRAGRMRRAFSGSARTRYCATFSPVSSYILQTTLKSKCTTVFTMTALNSLTGFSLPASGILPSAHACTALSRNRTCTSWGLCVT